MMQADVVLKIGVRLPGVQYASVIHTSTVISTLNIFIFWIHMHYYSVKWLVKVSLYPACKWVRVLSFFIFRGRGVTGVGGPWVGGRGLPCRHYLSPRYLFLSAISAACRSSGAALTIHRVLVLLWTGTSCFWNNNTLFKILFLSFSKPNYS